ncbi:HlyD family secretion protein [Marinobacter nanhaiticus D15-8W]|uniref:HlyD family secretion protein n=1 Tax=Marinobacter nanhaiticus D15-8W TaxID=626887 RepID=N6VY16_9GAMM|nr:HlyD family secretion protein [Marinobacter nanhaiticus]ENO15165.1 HlyD family secretion protein [Marinobacter nanhaiticus D15-8W]BES69134.1 HlyD family secretion protein [Marinobacter nanhaiticus D15-8W]
MTPDQSFARWVHVSLVAFVVLFVYFLIADLWMPVTPQARVMHSVVQVAPRVGGPIAQVYVHNNQHVETGDILFTLDQRPYALALEKAELALESASVQNDQYDAAIAAAEAQLASAQVQADELSREAARMERLLDRGGVSRQQADQTRSQFDAAKAEVQAARAQVHQVEVQRGLTDGQNLRLRQARNALAQAQLDLNYTQIRAEESGVISNLQVEPGTYAKAGTSLAALVADEADVIADFREKSLAHMQPGARAAVVFDALPGRVFDARVNAVDAGTRQGQLAADGSLASPDATDRWVRDAQRQRVHLQLTDAPDLLERLPSGARATVQLFPVEGVAAWLGSLQIHAVSLIHYVY